MKKLFKLCRKVYPNEMVILSISVHDSQSLIMLKLDSSDEVLHIADSIKELKQKIKASMILSPSYFDKKEVLNLKGLN